MPRRVYYKPRKPKRRRNPGPTGNTTQIPPGSLPPLDELLRTVLGAVFGFPDKAPTIIKADIPDEMYRKLLMLCHPDKHGNSETATEVTRWLIEERAKGWR